MEERWEVGFISILAGMDDLLRSRCGTEVQADSRVVSLGWSTSD